MKSKTRFFWLSGVAAMAIALNACVVDSTTTEEITTPGETPNPASTAVSTSPQTIEPKVNINTASEEELKKLATKLSVPDLPKKILAERPYKNIDELVSKEVISPPQLDYIKNDITLEKPEEPEEPEKSEESEESE